MSKDDNPAAFIAPSATRDVPFESEWTIETIHQKPDSELDCEIILYANLCPFDVRNLLLHLKTKDDEQVIAVYRQDYHRRIDYTERWLRWEE